MADNLNTTNLPSSPVDAELKRPLFAEFDDLDPADQEWVLDRLRRNIEHVLQERDARCKFASRRQQRDRQSRSRPS